MLSRFRMVFYEVEEVGSIIPSQFDISCGQL